MPMVPYHALPFLHQEMQADCQPACTSFGGAFKEVVGALIKQGKNPAYTIVRPLPVTARPYQYGTYKAAKC